MFKGFIFTKHLKSGIVSKALILASVSVSIADQNVLAQEANKAVSPNFKVRLINLEVPSTEVFRYSGTITNPSGQEKIYELHSSLPPGWSVAYKTEGMQVTSINLEPHASKEVSIEITPSYTADIKKHIIPIKAIAQGDTTVVNLESVIKGTYKMEISTQNQVLSGSTTTGSKKEVFITVKNTGTIPLENIELTTQLPSKWESSFEVDKIDKLEPGKTKDIKVNIKVPDKTIAGDYMVNVSAKNNHLDSSLAYRMEVKTSLLTGWIGMLLIGLAIVFIYLLVRKYGRR
ncbi:NPCBM-associated, NEW3 domain of alpha-galactosidase [Sphingobacterium nematocida]|uniref:NPCBM-associated, NEW3 domain of alpha-galactosidase n=1 Tax=Sphingobacterium nematocida TaxID=1513896 RepID=A0A1T5F5P9_9SPHI|nr:NEW3 domain-containing protein [Sphingobacterium nematocida]SKB91492.1 NPCBM-associated, NEW3 domain of alpha-galactosidase [Sphingobacterium nematocida]